MSIWIPLRASNRLSCHLLVRCRLPLHTVNLNQTHLLSNSLSRKTIVISACNFNSTSYKDRPLVKLPNTNLIFVPKRSFGRGKRGPPFGHRFSQPDSYLEIFTMAFIVVGFVLVSIDWPTLERDYGIKPWPLIAFFVSSVPVPAIDKTVPSSAALFYEEEKQNIHQFMQEEAARRALEEAKSDPEMLAIMEGREIVPQDAADFVIKKDYIRKLTSLKAEEEEEATSISFKKLLSVVSEDEDDQGESADKKVGFRNQKIIQYENRIRQYSTPDKIFRYFATYRLTDEKGHVGEAMMTPDDFLRSITPGMKQPENLGLDQFICVTGDEVTKLSLQLGVEDNSIFHQLGSGGLISFSDYIFLLTVLSTSRRHFEIAFKMFDLNGDGNVDAKEFEVVTNLMRSQSSTGIRHRDHQTTGSTFKGINSGLNNYFFGVDREGILTVEKFLHFQRSLQNEILKLEFSRKIRDNDAKKDGADNEVKRISEKDFADLLIAYAGFPPKKKARMLKRVKKAFGGDHQHEGISLEDFLNFYQVLYAINDIDTALTYHTIAGAPVERSTMKHVAQTVARVKLSDHIIDVVFILFDDNGDGKLSNKEFVSVMKQRAMRGLEKPKDTGIGRIFSAMTKCAAESRPTIIGGVRREDCAEIIRLIQELADFEKMPDGPKIDQKVLEEDGFGEKSFFQSFVAEDSAVPNRIIGYVLFYYTYSTWMGRSVYMEDLYVTESYRGRGIGKKLWQICVQTALDMKCIRCNFSVLNWNQSSIDFYQKCGAYDLTKSEAWHSFRMDKEIMEKFADK